MKKLVQILLYVIVSVANGQSSDIVIWESDTLNLYSNPLELRTDWEKLDKIISNQIEEERIGITKDSVIEILPWGNYRTEWLIKKDSLFLVNIISFYKPQDKINLQRIFQTEQKLIFADWVNKNLSSFSGNCIVCNNNHAENTSIYPNETVLEFQNGILSSTTDYINSILKESKFSSANPNDKLNFIYGNVHWNKLPDLNNKNYQIWVSVKPKRNGQLEKIDWKNTYLIVDNTNIIQDKDNVFIKEAVRIAKKIPDWNVIIKQNEILKQTFAIIINDQMKKKYAR